MPWTKPGATKTARIANQDLQMHFYFGDASSAPPNVIRVRLDITADSADGVDRGAMDRAIQQTALTSQQRTDLFALLTLLRDDLLAFGGYLDVLVAGLFGVDCVLSGLAVTGGADMTPAVAKGAVLSNGVIKAVAAGDVTISAADGTNPRIDLIVVDSTGAKQVRAGTAAANPRPPARSANDVVVAAVHVPANDTSIAQGQIQDLRMFRDGGPITVAKQTTAVTFNNTAAIQTYFSFTLPSGLFLAGKTLRLACGGNLLFNSGTPTLTLTINYGGATMFADVSAAGAADPDRRGWALDCIIQAQGNSDQALNGYFQTSVGAVAPPTSGQAGDLAAANTISTVLAGSSTVDSDAGDRLVEVRFTMSVANAANEIVLEYGTAELV